MCALAARVLAITARQVFEFGASSVTMRRVAAEAQVSATAIYRHYPSRADLLDNACAYAFKGLALRLDANQEQMTVAGIASTYIDEAMQNPSAYRHLTRSTGGQALAWTTLLAPLAGALAMALHDGTCRPVCQPALSIVAATHGAVMLHIDGCIPTAPSAKLSLARFPDRINLIYAQEFACTA